MTPDGTIDIPYVPDRHFITTCGEYGRTAYCTCGHEFQLRENRLQAINDGREHARAVRAAGGSVSLGYYKPTEKVKGVK